MLVRGLIGAFLFLLSPVVAYGATLQTGEAIVITEAPPHNEYIAGGDVRVSVPLPADLLALAAALQVLAPIGGDVSAAGSTIAISAPVAGDVRVAGGHVTVTGRVQGDLAVFGGFVQIAGEAGEVYAGGGTVELTGGARGPVTVYAGTVSLSGTYAGDVHIVASNKLTIAPDTVIDGVLEYNAPEEAVVPAEAVVSGGVQYVGSAAFLPTAEEAQAFALAGVGIFLIVRLIAGMVTIGLLAGLFPVFSTTLADHVLGRGVAHTAKLLMLGLAVLILTPVLFFILLASFVGMGVAFLIGVLYVLALMLAYLFCAVVAGGALARTLWKRTTIEWKDAVLGMVLLYIVGLLPGIGGLIVFFLAATTLGALSLMTYRFLFKRQ